jgi:hypothetical protein
MPPTIHTARLVMTPVSERDLPPPPGAKAWPPKPPPPSSPTPSTPSPSPSSSPPPTTPTTPLSASSPASTPPPQPGSRSAPTPTPASSSTPHDPGMLLEGPCSSMDRATEFQLSPACSGRPIAVHIARSAACTRPRPSKLNIASTNGWQSTWQSPAARTRRCRHPCEDAEPDPRTRRPASLPQRCTWSAALTRPTPGLGAADVDDRGRGRASGRSSRSAHDPSPSGLAKQDMAGCGVGGRLLVLGLARPWWGKSVQ